MSMPCPKCGDLMVWADKEGLHLCKACRYPLRPKCCEKVMSKVYVHHNQHHSKGQWEHIGFYCKVCKKVVHRAKH